MDAGYYKVHSNQYIVLCSPPGRSRKSTALRIGKGFLSGLKEFGADVHFSTQASSVAALIRQFSEIKTSDHQSLTSYSSELGSLLGAKPAEMTDFLTDIYDAEPDWSKQTISRDLEKIPNPWFNLIGATTPQWMGDNLSKTAMEGGFVRRTLFIYEDSRLKIAFPSLTAEQLKLRKLLLHDLAVVAQQQGEFHFDDESREYYRYWYEEVNEPPTAGNHRISGYYECKHIHVLKVAMMLSLAQKDELVLERRDIETAIQLLESIEPGMKRSFIAVGKNENSVVQERVLSLLKQQGSMSYKEVVAICNRDMPNRRSIDELIDTLTVLGEIEMVSNGNGSRRFVSVNSGVDDD